MRHTKRHPDEERHIASVTHGGIFDAFSSHYRLKEIDVQSYLDIADALRRHGAATQEDQQALWRRIIFSP